MNKKIALVGTHGVGKSMICEKTLQILAIREATIKYTPNAYRSDYIEGVMKNINSGKTKPIHLAQISDNLAFVPEQFREILNDLFNQLGEMVKQTEETTLATHAKQLYLENLYAIQGKNILCDRSVLDAFVYYDYFARQINDPYLTNTTFIDIKKSAITYTCYNYSKIYLIEPSDREIENDGFRLTDKKQQLEVHKLFLEYFKDFDNVEIVNQEEVHKERFIEKIANYFI